MAVFRRRNAVSNRGGSSLTGSGPRGSSPAVLVLGCVRRQRFASVFRTRIFDRVSTGGETFRRQVALLLAGGHSCPSSGRRIGMSNLLLSIDDARHSFSLPAFCMIAAVLALKVDGGTVILPRFWKNAANRHTDRVGDSSGSSAMALDGNCFRVIEDVG